LIALFAWLVIELLLIGQAMHLDSFDVPAAFVLKFPNHHKYRRVSPPAIKLRKLTSDCK
jgi:hypothetical protein